MATVRPELIADVVEQVHDALTPLVDADWSVPARDLEWSCRRTAAHLADSYFAQAAQITAQPPADWVPAEVVMADDVHPERLLQAIDACAGLLRSAAACADPDVRAWHPMGTADPAGWLAMGIVEGLVHTWDIATSLGSAWRPSAEPCIPAIERLFPNAPADADPVDALLWCAGRISLPGHPRQRRWRWYSAVR